MPNVANPSTRHVRPHERGRARRLFVISALVGRYGRDVVSGIGKYCATFGKWEFYLEPSYEIAVATASEAIHVWKADGIIAHVGDQRLVPMLARADKPVVNTSSSLNVKSIPSVLIDNVAVGRVAAEYFLQRGHSTFAFCGDGRSYSQHRREGFFQVLRQHGHDSADLEKDCPRDVLSNWMLLRSHLRDWVLGLPKPIAIMACNDVVGRELILVCQQAGITVPEEVAVVGVDNEELFCSMLHPPLSSVDIPAERVGYEAAALLHRMIKGRRPPEQPILIPPIGVTVRQSSELPDIPDPRVAQALEFITGHAHEPISVKDVLQHVLVSRRSLERAFLGILNRSPGAEISRAHLELAKRLLLRTDLPIAEVAVRSGFTSASMLSTVWRRATGIAPQKYRRQFRAPSPGGLLQP